MGRAIGIDLGTTNSCAAIIEGGQPKVITYRNGQKTIPSVFAIDKTGKRLVGEEAREQAALNPEATVAASKRLIGRSFGSDAMQKFQQVFTYELAESENSEVLVKVQGQLFTLEQISAAILRRIKDNAEEAIGETVDQAVITVPAYFNDRQRQAVRSAGKLAGLKVLRVLNEPTAAALAYGLGRTLDQTVAIYDLGGGTFDISIIKIKDKIFEVMATGGDTFLGGVDFDDRLMQHVLANFLHETGIDLSYDRSAVTRVRQSAEDVKIRLSSSAEEVLEIKEICKDDDGTVLDLRTTITRETLEKLTEDLVDRSIKTCERILGEANIVRDQLDEILLVGGQSRMPLVRRRVESFLGRPPSRKVHPDEAVGIGASIMAHSLVSRGVGADMTLLDVLPMAIGIGKPDGKMHVLFPKNQQLPHFETRKLTTSRDNQTSIQVVMYQGESRLVEENELLGRFVFNGLRPGPKGNVTIEVTFDIDSEGILNLSARDTDTGQVVESQLKLGQDPEESARRKVKKVKKGEAEAEKVDKAEKPDAPKPPPMPLNMPTSSLLRRDPPEEMDRANTQPNAPDRSQAPRTADSPRSSGDRAPAPPVSDEVRKADRAAPIEPLAQPKPTTPGPASTGPGQVPDFRQRELSTAAPTGWWARFTGWLSGLFRRKG
jgi:molecular chaperone DnaK